MMLPLSTNPDAVLGPYVRLPEKPTEPNLIHGVLKLLEVIPKHGTALPQIDTNWRDDAKHDFRITVIEGVADRHCRDDVILHRPSDDRPAL
jgi:hypothetical protein